MSSLAPSNHEEVDTHMILHAAHAAKNGHHEILIRTADTDVLVLAVMLAETLSPEHDIWLALEMAKVSDIW